MRNELRSKGHQRIDLVEDCLDELSSLLGPVNRSVIGTLRLEHRPVVHLVGCARSGTTLLHQLLVKHLEVCYPTNFMSRFYYAPVLGAKLQYLLTDLDFKKEILASFPDFSLSSSLGKTEGPLSPHEFWYFWRSIFEIGESGMIVSGDDKNLVQFYSQLDGITTVFQKPMIIKSMIAQNRISDFINYRPGDKIIYLKRSTAYNAQSLLKARLDYFGDMNQWYSFKPLNYQISGSSYQQVVEQVIRTNEMIESDLCKVDPKNIFKVNYEEINEKFDHLIEWLGFEKKNNTEPSISTFTPRNKIRDNQEFEEIVNWINKR